MIDNVVDMAHFFYVHFAFPTSFRNVFEGTRRDPVHGVEGPARHRPGGYGDADLFLKSEATYFGPSYMINWLDVDYKGFETEVILINCHIPTGAELVHAAVRHHRQEARGHRRRDRGSTSRRSTPRCSARASCRTCTSGRTRSPVQNPLLCEEDGPVYQLRRWYEQFYVDKADIVPEMVDRFEFEVDTTKANEYWQEEVAENLAAAEAEVRGDGGRLMPSFVPTSADTLEDQRLYTTARLVEVACLDCLARVGREEEQRAPHRRSSGPPRPARTARSSPGARPAAATSTGLPAAGGQHRARPSATGGSPIGAEDGY